MIRILIVIWTCLILGGVVSAQSKEDLQRQKQKAFDDIKLARELMEKTAAQRSNSVQQLRILQRGINSRAKVISTLESEVSLFSQNILDTQTRIEQLTAENARNKEEYSRLIYYAYRNHTDYEKLMYILAGSTISQSYQRYKYLKYLGEYRVRKAAEIEASIVELAKQQSSLSSLKNEKLGLMENKESEQQKLVSQRSREASMVNDLKRRESELQKEIREKERIAREVEARIREIIEEEARRSSSNDIYGALTPEQELVGSDFRKNKGKLPWPVEKGIITIGYGNHEVPGLRGSSVKTTG
jgi:septal ring factor EnvC (AmiA/AmiB activator)